MNGSKRHLKHEVATPCSGYKVLVYLSIVCKSCRSPLVGVAGVDALKKRVFRSGGTCGGGRHCGGGDVDTM